MRDKWQMAALAVVVAVCSWGAGADDTTESAKPEAKPESEFKPPPGYRTRKRGDKVVYCKKVSIPESRLMTEKCYDQVQLREIELQMEQQRNEIDQRRRICPTPATCGA